MRDADAIVVGAGPAGLACAVTLRAAGLDVMVMEKADKVDAVWRRHYDRLHLHTDRNRSGLPGMPMPQNYWCIHLGSRWFYTSNTMPHISTSGLLSTRRSRAFGATAGVGAPTRMKARPQPP